MFYGRRGLASGNRAAGDRPFDARVRDAPAMLEVRSGVATATAPIAAGELDEVGDAIRVLHVGVPIAGGDADAVNALLTRRPDLRVRLIPRRDEQLADLSALAALPAVRHLLVDFGALYSDVGSGLRLEGVQHAPALERLQIHLDKPVSLAPLAGHPGLRGLLVAGPHRDFEVLGELPRLEDLTLRSTPLKDLAPIAAARGLRALDLKLGGIADLTRLRDLTRLEYLEIWRVRGLRDLSPISALHELRLLILQAMSKVQELPDLSRCTELREIVLDTMKGIDDFTPLARAPALTALAMYAMPQANPDNLAPLRDHPTLEAARIGTGSVRRNAAIEALLGLPDTWAGRGYVRRWAA